MTAEPVRSSEIGSGIARYLQTGEVDPLALQLLFCADRAQHLRDTILPARAAGEWVVCDRYHLSTVAYTEPRQRAAIVALGAAVFPQPDLTILLDIDATTALARIAARGEQREIFEQTEKLTATAAAYRAAVAELPADKRLVLNSGVLSIDALAAKIAAYLQL